MLMALAPFYIAGDVVGLLLKNTTIIMLVCLLGAVIILGVCVSILFAIHKVRQVNADVIMGGICVFLLIGQFFYMIYFSMYLFDASAFDFTSHGKHPPLLNAMGMIFYFSYSCLLTSGFGDIVPMNAWGQCLSVLEGIAGQCFLVVFIARLVNLQYRAPSGSDRPQELRRPLD